MGKGPSAAIGMVVMVIAAAGAAGAPPSSCLLVQVITSEAAAIFFRSAIVLEGLRCRSRWRKNSKRARVYVSNASSRLILSMSVK